MLVELTPFGVLELKDDIVPAAGLCRVEEQRLWFTYNMTRDF